MKNGGVALKTRDFWLQYFPMGLAGVLIVSLGIAFGQPFYKMLPMLNTLVIMLLSANANRYTFLFGGINAAIYGIVYLSEHVYFSAISAIVISFPMQLFSFFYWKKRENGGAGTLRVMGWGGRIATLATVAFGSLACYHLLLPYFMNAAFPAVDVVLFTLGIVITVLTAFCVVEAQYLNVASCVLNLVLWFLISSQNPSNINYLVIGAYNLFRVVQGCIVWTRKYHLQRANAKKESGGA